MESRLLKQLFPEGKGKEQVKKEDEVKLDVAEDNDKVEMERESDADVTKMIKEDLSPDRVLVRQGKGKELQVKEADDVKLDVTEDTDKDEIDDECDAGASMNKQYLSSEHDHVYEYARSIVERAKGECALYRVHSSLRDGSDKQYEPVLVSIGPYHHGNPALQDMEKKKQYYMQELLERLNEKSIARFVDALKKEEGEPQALHCYRDTHQMTLESLVNCMVCDGLFLVELLREEEEGWLGEKRNDIIFNRTWMVPLLKRDMLLYENQIPLSVFRALSAILTKQTRDEDDFVDRVGNFFYFNGKTLPELNPQTSQLDDIPHLLGLVYEALVVSKAEASKTKTPEQQNRRRKSLLKFLINKWSAFVRIMKPLWSPFVRVMKALWSPFVRIIKALWSPFVRVMKALWSPLVRIMKALVPKTPEQSNSGQKSWKSIRTAVALEQVGVLFQSAKDPKNFYDIRFSDGVLSIPPLAIDDGTESFFRNLVAYEQYNRKYYNIQQVGDYLRVMDCLINSSKDVELLRHSEIIDNDLGDDEKVSTMFNRLYSGVCHDPETFFYAEMFNKVNKFCKNPWNTRMAKLKNEYFGSPWSLISFIAAFLLLLFAAFQTGYSVASYYQPKIYG